MSALLNGTAPRGGAGGGSHTSDDDDYSVGADSAAAESAVGGGDGDDFGMMSGEGSAILSGPTGDADAASSSAGEATKLAQRETKHVRMWRGVVVRIFHDE